MCDESLYKYPSFRENHNDKQITSNWNSGQATVLFVNIHQIQKNFLKNFL